MRCQCARSILAAGALSAAPALARDAEACARPGVATMGAIRPLVTSATAWRGELRCEPPSAARLPAMDTASTACARVRAVAAPMPLPPPVISVLAVQGPHHTFSAAARCAPPADATDRGPPGRAGARSALIAQLRRGMQFSRGRRAWSRQAAQARGRPSGSSSRDPARRCCRRPGSNAGLVADAVQNGASCAVDRRAFVSLPGRQFDDVDACRLHARDGDGTGVTPSAPTSRWRRHRDRLRPRQCARRRTPPAESACGFQAAAVGVRAAVGERRDEGRQR